ncbi:MmcQ/YjbR family DNA-binding protein [Kribbella sp. NPDC026611]|uniref:MmcQ/YjbR family DNA-binding protein n=1 Tax=Kribbella sp. NPDC026611 TaxID=3154911 RepID=UPI0033FB908C
MDARAVLKVVQGLPGAEEHEGWAGQPVFKVRKKSFAYMSEDESRLHLKSLREEQEALVAESPDVYAPSWDGGRFAWVLVHLEPADDEEVQELITEAWRLTAPKYLIAQLA